MPNSKSLWGIAIVGCLGLVACADRATGSPPSSAGAQRPSVASAAPSGGGCGLNEGVGRLYDPSTVESARGKVLRVEHVTPKSGRSHGVHVVLTLDGGGTLAVHLGPAWFIEGQAFGIQPGDTLDVTGSRVTFDGAPALIARKVANGARELVLRDDAGLPVWGGGRGRGAR